jgi:four helix bundle protein
VKQADLKERTMRFALDACRMCRCLQDDWPQKRVSDQLFRSSTAIAANYRAATRGRSPREFVAKLGIVVEEAEETVFWLEFVRRAGMKQDEQVGGLLSEARELLAIFVASRKTANSNLQRR